MVKAITPPEEFFGHRLGADRKIARWDRIVEYFNLLQKESDKIVVENMGPTTEGNPFLLVTISSPRNIRDLEKIKKTNAQIADPRRLDEAKAEQLIKKGKAVICQSMSLHAT